MTKNVPSTSSLQALQESEARGKILHYTVTFEALSHGEPKATETTTQTSYTKAAPKMDYKITVTADNSRGSSPPASILTNLSIQGKAFHCSQPLEITSALLCTAHSYVPQKHSDSATWCSFMLICTHLQGSAVTAVQIHSQMWSRTAVWFPDEPSCPQSALP